MNKDNGIRRLDLRTAAAWLGALAVAAVFLTMPEHTAEGAESGIKLCMNVALPSLFPMMFATVLIVETGLAQAFGRRISGIARRAFALGGEAGVAVLLAMIGGFPAGAKAVKGLYRRGAMSRADAERMVLFCFSSGPAFLVGAVGRMYGDSRIGFLLLGIQLLSVIIMGFLSKLLPREKSVDSAEEKCSAKPSDFFGSVTSSAAQTASAMLNICLFIILFSTFRVTLEKSGASAMLEAALIRAGLRQETAQSVLPVLLEVTSGCAAAVRSGLPATAFAVGFGGVAVHMQVMSICEGISVKYWRFMLARIVQGVICSLLARLCLLIMPARAVTASAHLSVDAALSATPTGAITLVVMSAMCVLCLSGLNEEKIRR